MTSGSDDAAKATVTNNEEAHRYEVAVEGVTAGVLTYQLHENQVIFKHAEVYPRFEGQGVGSELARQALDDVVEQDKVITPLCPFIVNYLGGHPSYLPHVDEVHRREIEALIAVAPEGDEVA